MAQTEASLPGKYVRGETGVRPVDGPRGWLIAAVAIGWSLFQIAVADPYLFGRWFLLGSETVRSVHLAFAAGLVYLSYPALGAGRIRARLADRGPGLRWLIRTDGVPWPDLVLAAVAALAALALALDQDGIATRQGMMSPRDRITGIVLTVFLLGAAWRALGPALPILAGVFILYSFVSGAPWMPEVLSMRSATLDRVLGKLSHGTEGIYGIPLGVSARTVFLFVLFGAMLDRAGGGKFFMRLAYSLLGGFRGGPAKASVVSSGLTAMVSGSSIANVVTTGTFTIPLMVRSGFSAVKAGAVEVAASTNGQLMPPVMGAAAFIIAEYCNMPYLEVVRAAFVPALISYLALLFIVHLEAHKQGLGAVPRSQLPPFFRTLAEGAPFLIPLAFLLHQLVILRRSAELSAYHALLALVGLIVVRRVIRSCREGDAAGRGLADGCRDVVAGLSAGGRNMMGIGVAVATAGIIVGIVTMGLGSAITEIIGVLAMGSLPLLLIITALASLLLGLGLPTTANYIVMATLTAPAIYTLGNELGLGIPLIAAHLFCFYFGILADDTPPVGLAAYAASAISGADPIRTGIQGFLYDSRTALLPFLFVFNTDLLLWDITGWLRPIWILITGTAAMFAFASLTQGWLLRRNRIWESGLLVAAILLALRPGLVESWIGREPARTLGLALFLAVWGLQALGRKHRLTETRPGGML